MALLGTYGITMGGVLLCRWSRQALKGPPWVGRYSLGVRVRHLRGHHGWGHTL